MAKKKNIDIPDGYEVVDPSDDLRDLGLSEKDIKELEDEIRNEVESVCNRELTPEESRLYDIIYSDTATREEKEAARRQLDPDMYDENGNIILNDGVFLPAWKQA